MEGLLAGAGPQRKGSLGEGWRPRVGRDTMQIGKRGRSTLVFLCVFTKNTVFYLDIPIDKTYRGRESGECRGGLKSGSDGKQADN